MILLILLFISNFNLNTQGLPIKTISICKLNNDLSEPNPINIKSLPLQKRKGYTNLLFDIRFVIFHDNRNGKIGKKVLEKQIDILNEGFSGKYSKKNMIDSQFKFRIGSIQYVNNKTYYNYCDAYGTEMASLYGKNNDLNINIMVCNSMNYLGWAYFPWYWEEKVPLYSVFIHTLSLPGSELIFYNLGKTIIHEIGHFFGLLHTFSEKDECVDSDYVLDTPTEKSPNWYCDESRDSCPDQEGKDPITNFMDYSLDGCKYEFTNGQINRMRYMIDLYKPVLKKQSISNYLSTNPKYTLYFYKLNMGVCRTMDRKNINIIRYKPNNKYIARHICDKKAYEEHASAYTFTSPKFVPYELKYNCLIHFFPLQETITTEIKSEKNRKSECYIPKVSTHTINIPFSTTTSGITHTIQP